MAVSVGEGVVTCGVGDEGKGVEAGMPVGVLLGMLGAVGEEAVGDARGTGRAVSVAETASAIAVAAAPLGSAVLLHAGEHAVTSSKMQPAMHSVRKVLRLTFYLCT
jgi:hypothetical protein